MGKTRTQTKSGSGRDVLHSTSFSRVKTTPKKAKSHVSVDDLLTEAAALLEQSQPDLALPLVKDALRKLEKDTDAYADIDVLLQCVADGNPTFPQALVLSAEINLALGDGDTARRQFLQATEIDPDGALISAEPYLWLSQLSQEGGQQSVHFFEKAIEVLRNEVEVLEDTDMDIAQHNQILDEKRVKLANTLCGMTEIYMTDLSWEDDSEARCEQFVMEAIAICPEGLSAGVLQTLANVRISQERTDEARRALANSMMLWKDIPQETEDPARPDFATRVSLARLLMEVEVEADALFVIEGLIKEDDHSVESLYLGGWCHILLSGKQNISSEDKRRHQEQAKLWLGNSLKLYREQAYEDARLKDHASELIVEINRALGVPEDDMDEWEDAEDDDEEVDYSDNELQVDDEHRDGDVDMT